MNRKLKYFLSGSLIILVFILVIGSPIALVAVGVSVAKPYTKTSGFTETYCTVIQVRYIGLITCHCESGGVVKCKASYPCAEILVRYVTENGDTVSDATLFDNAHSFLNYGYIPVSDSAQALMCSTYACERDDRTNAALVHDFVRNHGDTGRNYTCYYNTHNNKEVLVSKISAGAVAAGMLLPLIFFAVGILLFIYIYHRVLCLRGETLFCLGRKYDFQANELSPAAPTNMTGSPENPIQTIDVLPLYHVPPRRKTRSSRSATSGGSTSGMSSTC